MSSILIRKLSLEDASISFRWRNDSEIWKYTGNRPDRFITEDIEKNWLTKILSEKNSSRFAILVDNIYIGNIQITDIIEQEKGQYHIFIGDKSYWGKGIGRLATAQIFRFAKEKLNLKELYLKVNPENTSAIKLYEKCGFEKVNDEILMSLSLSNFIPPVVSVFVMTYNHEHFIKQALDGILMQKTNFDFEIVVGEDSSNDNTRQILKSIVDRYPGKFKLLLHNQNIGAIANQAAVHRACTGKYIAFCEGDDYWTDPYKLQKQVDFLETHPEYSVSCHNVEVKGSALQDNYIDIVKDYYTSKELVSGELSIATVSVLFRNINITYPDFLSKTPIGDFPLFVLIAQHGKIKYFPEIMGIRRVHENGLWSSADKSKKLSYMLTTIYFMIGNYNEETNNALIRYHLKLIANSIKDGVSSDLYPEEMKWVIKIMVQYTKARTFLRNLGLFKMFKFLFRIKKLI